MSLLKQIDFIVSESLGFFGAVGAPRWDGRRRVMVSLLRRWRLFGAKESSEVKSSSFPPSPGKKGEKPFFTSHR